MRSNAGKREAERHLGAGQAGEPGAESESLDEALRRKASGGRIGCAAALEVADRFRVPPLEVGRACDRLGLKIVFCQLGCFGVRKGRPDDDRSPTAS